MAVFQIASTDAWTELMFTYMECSPWATTFAYHVFIWTFANVILLNVLIAIFLESYELDAGLAKPELLTLKQTNKTQVSFTAGCRTAAR